MRLDNIELYNFNYIMQNGEDMEKRGDSYMNQPYYEEAKRWYLQAANEFKKAYDYADGYGDTERRDQAYRKQRNAENKRKDAIDALNRQDYGYGAGR